MRSKENPLEKKSSGKSGSSGKLIFKEKGKKNMKMKPKTKFEEFLELDMNKGIAGAEEDLEMERRLAKKLKVKGGKVRGDDGISELFEGIPSLLDPMSKGTVDDDIADDDIEDEDEDEDDNDDGDNDDGGGGSAAVDAAAAVNDNIDDDIMEPVSSSKKLKRNKSSRLSARRSENETAAATDRDAKLISSRKKRKKGSSLQSSREHREDGSVDAQLEREEEMHNAGSKGPDTLNEEPHVKAPKMDVSMKYVAPHLRANSNKESVELSQIRRRVRGLFNRLSESNVESITEEVASIFRSLSRGVGCEIIGDEVIASCSRGPRGNEQYAAVFAAFVAGMACIVGIDFSAKLIASIAKSFEDEYSKEDGLSLRNLTLLLSYIYVFGVCSSDLIYDFLSMLSKRLTEMDVSTILTVLQCCGMKLRGDDPTAMKDFVLNIQNRANEAKSQSGQDGKPKLNSKRMEFMLETIFDIKNNKKRPKEEPTNQTRIKKWLQKLRAEDIQLRSLRWNKLLDPQKKGQWWLSGEIASTVDNVEEVATTINREVLEAQKLLQLAAAQRMNTDVRRAIFCIIMSGEDYIDAFDKILRLDLSGKQDREIMRVLVECCLQEKVFNKYYTVLASKLCSHEKNHKFTLQYCIWDHYKELDSMELNRSMNLAGFVAEMLSTFSLSLALLKTAELMDPAQLTPRRIMHFRMLFEAVFDNSDALVWSIFTRVASAPELEMLRSGLVFFIKQYVVAANSRKEFAGKYRLAKKALQNVAGVLM